MKSSTNLTNQPNQKLMLKKRILTALILIPLVVLIIFFAPPIIFAVLSLIVFLYAFKEWLTLTGITQEYPGKKIIKPLSISLGISISLVFILAVLALIGIFLVLLILNFLFNVEITEPHPYFFWAGFVIALWCLPVLSIVFYPKGSNFYTRGQPSMIIGMVILSLAWFSLCLLQAYHPMLALYPLVLVWIADSVAFFVGKRYGQFKLAPQVSPGKTWEGLLGAVLASMFFSIFAYYFLRFYYGMAFNFSIFSWLLFNMIVVLFSAVGDLFESIFKRAHNVKDSGTLLPGHGGLLDRIDAQLSAIPIFAMGYFAFFAG